ncbi:hypothetical protein J3D54_000422 [Pseudomonas sp. GGS8]|uniref:hypothetical protein n=1 Tax=Pseudomonas sp. GGS8 TaxID=2817892 RepID=UPI00209DCEC2|nr:hypothetical protein [Pseudomonas sp. GGS8]MCP1441290.1 hypothetical protein [Pseudomonas sp. GGS8]
MTTENEALPVPVIQSPAKDATASNKVSISGTVEDNGEGEVTIYRDLSMQILLKVDVVEGKWSGILREDLSKGDHAIAAMLTRQGEHSRRSEYRQFKVE